MWEEVHPYLKFEAPQRRGVLHDSENGFSLRFGVEMWRNFGALMENNGGEERKKKKLRGREKKSCWNFWRRREKFGFYKKNWFSFAFFFIKQCHLSHFKRSKKGPTFFSWCDFILSHKEEKFDLLNAKILPQFACRLSGSNSLRFSAPVEARFRK